MAGQRPSLQKLHNKRMCISCKKRTDPLNLIRFNYINEKIVCVPPGKKRSGRGVNLCPNRECFKIAVKKHLFNKGFKVKDNFKHLCVDKLLAEASKEYKKRLHDLLRSKGPQLEERVIPINLIIEQLEIAQKINN